MRASSAPKIALNRPIETASLRYGVCDQPRRGNDDPAGHDALAGTVDEAVLQIYQGRHVIPGYAECLGKLGRMKVPFRIGLLQGGAWRTPPALSRYPLFRGFVVFLRNDR